MTEQKGDDILSQITNLFSLLLMVAIGKAVFATIDTELEELYRKKSLNDLNDKLLYLESRMVTLYIQMTDEVIRP